MNQSQLFNKQLTKGRVGEMCFHSMSRNHFDEVNDYTNHTMWKDVQEKGIDFGFKMNSWQNEKTCDVKANLYYQDNQYYTGWVMPIEYEKWCPEYYDKHKREVQPGWIQDSKANRIYHWDVRKENNSWIPTQNYVYYDLDEMRSFIFREWDKGPTGWLQKMSFVATWDSDYTRLIPVRLTDERFKHIIRKINIEGING
tara:strand:- start:613 stop:1206 length:594 start_codon:yes stop_codon:yes gene_type:complete